MAAALSKTNVVSPDAATLNDPAIAEAPSETRVLLEGVSWETYERLLEETGERRNQQFA